MLVAKRGVAIVIGRDRVAAGRKLPPSRMWLFPPLSPTVARYIDPSKKETDPTGVPDAALTVAVKVTA